MFAILKTGGKQYKVAKEEKLLIEKIDGNICLLYTSDAADD